jgi:hypothetical protein
LSIDELHGILTTYEMRTKHDNPVIKEATFKASKKTNNKDKKNPKSDCSCNDDSEEDEEVDNFVRRLKPGTGKYKAKLPLICFNCDGVGHFSNKCPYKKKKINEDEYDPKNKNQKGRRNKKKFFKKSLCTKEDKFSSDEDEVSNNDTERVLFMAIKDSNDEGSEEEYE